MQEEDALCQVNEEIIDEDVEEFEVGMIKGEPTGRKQIALLLTICCMVALIVLIILIGCLVILYFTIAAEEALVTPPPYFSRNDVLNTLEFQIPLEPSDWNRREGMTTIWIERMNKHNNLFTISREAAIEDIYMQYHLIGTSEARCSISEDTKLRFRSYAVSKENTVDIKQKEQGYFTFTCSEPFWAAEKYYNTSKQKCEEDFHPCFTKYTRGTSVFFDDPKKTFPYCSSLVDVFPDAFPTINNGNSENRVSASAKTYWWKLKWTEELDGDMMCDISITLEYDTINEAEGKADSYNVIDGEWSLRVYSLSNGSWDDDVLHELKKLFYHLIQDFDTDESHLECAHNFLS